MMGTIQRCQGEALRQQGDFRLAMTRLLRQIQQDNATPLDAHLSRLENVDRELASLRAELERRGTHTAPPLRNQGTAQIRVPPRLLQKYVSVRQMVRASGRGAGSGRALLGRGPHVRTSRRLRAVETAETARTIWRTLTVFLVRAEAYSLRQVASR
jgi:hypothetical protein